MNLQDPLVIGLTGTALAAVGYAFHIKRRAERFTRPASGTPSPSSPAQPPCSGWWLRPCLRSRPGPPLPTSSTTGCPTSFPSRLRRIGVNECSLFSALSALCGSSIGSGGTGPAPAPFLKQKRSKIGNRSPYRKRAFGKANGCFATSPRQGYPKKPSTIHSTPSSSHPRTP